MIEYIKQYREDKSASYSALSAMDVHPSNLLKESETTEYFTFGSLVDCLAFTPDSFNDSFYITTIPKPTEKMGEWLDAFIGMDIPPNYELQNVEHLILTARKQVGYNLTWKDETCLTKFNEQCIPYLDSIAKAGDRNIITQEEYDKAISYISRLLNNPFTGKYFQKVDKGTELHFQVPLYYTIEDVPFKSLIDCLYIDHTNKTIQVVDLKTTSDALSSFEKSFMKYRYYIQAGLYIQAVKLAYPLALSGYTVVNNFKFVVINPFEEPMVWVVDEKTLSTIWHGGNTKYGKNINGIYQLIEQYKWHKETGLYDYPAPVYQSHGERTIDVF